MGSDSAGRVTNNEQVFVRVRRSQSALLLFLPLSHNYGLSLQVHQWTELSNERLLVHVVFNKFAPFVIAPRIGRRELETADVVQAQFLSASIGCSHQPVAYLRVMSPGAR